MKNFEEPPQCAASQEASRVNGQETEISPEQKEILESAKIFAKYLTDKWPQVDTGIESVVEIDDKGTTGKLPELPEKINYYLAGSLALTLLSQAESFTVIKLTKTDETTARTTEIPESARRILASFARQIGDLDYVPTDHYKGNPNRLKKGGGGPSFDEVPPAGRKVLKRGEGQIKVMCDPLEVYDAIGIDAIGIAKINVDGRDYYISRPDIMFAYKVLHLLQAYEQKPEDFNTDFGKILKALREMYSQEELLQTTQQILKSYEDAMERLHILLNKHKENPPAYERKIPKFIERVLASSQVSPEIRDTLENLKKTYP